MKKMKDGISELGLATLRTTAVIRQVMGIRDPARRLQPQSSDANSAEPS